MRRTSRILFESFEPRVLFATVVVSNLNNSGAGSLRQAIADANAEDTIDLTGVAGTITVDSWLNIDKGLTIQGPGQDVLTISGGGTQRIINQSANLTLLDVTLDDGFSNSDGGAIYQGTHSLAMSRVTISNSTARSAGAISSSGWAAILDITDCTFTGNTAVNGVGGAILHTGSVGNILRCTFSDNSATAQAREDIFDPEEMRPGNGRGGAIAIYQGNVVFTNCTIADNTVNGTDGTTLTATAYGGGIYYVNTGSTTFINCTISGNTANATGSAGGGIYFDNNSHTVTNTIIASNTTTSGSEPDVHVSSGVSSGGYNLIGSIDTNSVFVNATNHDQAGTIATPINAQLGALADNGGETKTVALLSGSPAADAGTSTGAPTTDQRGQARVGATDIGAYELTDTNDAPSFTSTPITEAGAGTVYTYTVTATDPDVGDGLTITAPTKPSWLTLTDNGNGTASFTGTPDYENYGAAEVVLQVSDGEESVQQTYTLNISVPRTALDEDNTLHVNGTDAADNIQVWIRQKNSVRVTINDVIRNFSLSEVDDVEVLTFGGNDTVVINISTLSSLVSGGDGDDSLTGGAGADSMTGGAGKDLLTGNDGADTLAGGGGKDKIVGGAGLDHLSGQAGNDLFYDRDGSADTFVGGADDDSAETDQNIDLISGIETLLA